MRTFWRWIPALVATLVWVAITGLLQPWASRAGILIFTDAVLLLAPARFFARTPAIVTVLFGALAVDALRPGPYGLSATLLLPVLLLILPFQKSLRDWNIGAWLAGAVALNTLLLAVSSRVWVARMRPAPTDFPPLDWVGPVLQPSLQCVVASAFVSALVLLIAGNWFVSLQINLLRLTGIDVENPDENAPPDAL